MIHGVLVPKLSLTDLLSPLRNHRVAVTPGRPLAFTHPFFLQSFTQSFFLLLLLFFNQYILPVAKVIY